MTTAVPTSSKVGMLIEAIRRQPNQLQTKKHLTLIRHAKSSWGDASLRDFDRPLNERGLRDAPRIGAYLKERGFPTADQILYALKPSRLSLTIYLP